MSVNERSARRESRRYSCGKYRKHPCRKCKRYRYRKRDRSGCALYDHVYFRNNRKKQRCDADPAKSCGKCDLSGYENRRKFGNFICASDSSCILSEHGYLKRIFGGKHDLYQRFAHARGEKYTIVPTTDHADGSADD